MEDEDYSPQYLHTRLGVKSRLYYRDVIFNTKNFIGLITSFPTLISPTSVKKIFTRK